MTHTLEAGPVTARLAVRRSLVWMDTLRLGVVDEPAVARFDKRQLRDPHTGEWVTTPGLGMTPPAGQAALDAVPAKLTPDPQGHYGTYDAEKLSGPKGVGSARALSEYEGVEYDRTNGYLRNPERWESASSDIRQGMIDEVRARVADIDRTMAASRLDTDIQVERVIKSGRSVFGDAYYSDDMNSDDFDRQDAGYARWQAGERPDLTGLRFRDLAYVSTSADPRIDQAFGGRWAQTAKEMPSTDGEAIVMKIQIPKGTGAVALGGMGEMGPKGLTDSAEILLQRGLSFEIIADHGVGEDGFRRLDVEVVSGD